MIQSSQTLLPLWDYGWCKHERIALPPCHTPSDVIREYRHSDAFGSNFVGPQPLPARALHGPFVRSLISDSDFELVPPQRFHDLIEAIPRTSGFTDPPTDEQWNAIRRVAVDMSNHHIWLIALRLTEDDQDRFHDFGFVLSIFREFICTSPEKEFAERLVFGYD